MANKIKKPTEDQKVQAFLRQIAVERKQVVLGVLYNSISGGADPTPDLVDKAFALADYYIEKCYPLPKEEEKKEYD